MSDDCFKISSPLANEVLQTAAVVEKWCKEVENTTEVNAFEEKLVKSFDSCFSYTGKVYKKQRETMWSSYHSLRSSKVYETLWSDFLLNKVGVSEVSVIFCQYVGDYVLKELAKIHFPLSETEKVVDHETLTYEERNGLRYAAGYVPRSLKKKLAKSANPHKKDLMLCLPNLLDQEEDVDDDSSDWIDAVNRGGLTKVNNDTYELFVAMEVELRKQLALKKVPELSEDTKQAMVQNDNVQFLWSIICNEWDEEVGNILLEMIVNEWVTIRGFSYASAWIEKFKQATKVTIEKSKGLRKQLIPKKSD